jgi:hypothetical protein
MFPIQYFSPITKLGTSTKGVHLVAIVALLSLASSLVSAYDPSPLQDICVAVDDPNSAGIYFFIYRHSA